MSTHNPSDADPAPAAHGAHGAHDAPAHRYTARFADHIETRWQNFWEQHGTFTQPNPGQPGFDASRPKFYCLDMFPYPSGAGLHVGHPLSYTATDIVSRFMRMQGRNVLHPMGWDAFGLPAEQYAIQTGIHPSITTKQATDNFRRQLKRFGFSYDWSREISTIDPEYYKWTQWIFLRAYNAWYDPSQADGGKARPINELIAELESGDLRIGLGGELVHIGSAATTGIIGGEPVGTRRWLSMTARCWVAFSSCQRLAYIDEAIVNWCPKLGTVLANDEVIDGRSERGGHPVLRKPLRQWMFRITAYAERLLRDLDSVDWPSSTKTMQSEWIGRSEGAEIDFTLGSSPLRGENHLIEATARLTSDPQAGLQPRGFVGKNPYPPDVYGAAADVLIRTRNLPHMEMPGATYFVTWKAVQETHFSAAQMDAVLSALRHFDSWRCRVYVANVMSNHVHWIVRPFEGQGLRELVRSVKRYCAIEVNRIDGGSGHVWEPDCFDHIICDTQHFNEFVKYCIDNPVTAGVVSVPSDYSWSFVHAEAVSSERAAERRGTQNDGSIRVFTTRPDTIFGATFMVVAPEHPLVQSAARSDGLLPEAERLALRAYVTAAKNRSEVDRMADAKDKTGVFTGLHCENPATGELIPIYTADYVLMSYGHGAIMAVPAHDERDFAFARKFNLPIRDVVYPRTQMVIEFYTRHATREEEESGRWKLVLADLLGLGATANIKPDMLGELLDAVRSRREEPAAPSGSPAAHFVPRGMIAAEYIEAIDEIGDLEAIRRQYRSASVFASGGAAFSGNGYAVNSSCPAGAGGEAVTLDMLSTEDAKQRIIDWLEKSGRGNRKINFRLRDWAFSRQRYWGEPFPIVFDEQGRHYPVSDAALPVTLPELADYSPVESDDPMPLLAKATQWMNTTAGAAGVSPDLLAPETPVRREANTMPGSAGSSWYFLRYCDSRNSERFVSREAERYWLNADASCGTDIYIGGSEHAVGHLLYSRFWQKILFDLGEVEANEPFGKLYHQGLITSFAYQRADKTIVPTDEVSEVAEGKFAITATGENVTPVVTKMSKRYKNVVNPDDVIAEFGADTFRMYEMYMGPLDQSKPWNTKDAVGIFRFLQRLWRVAVDEQSGQLRLRPDADAAVEKQLHRTIHKVAQDIPRLAFNTAIAALIEFVNAATSAGGLTRDQLERITLALAPFAPHIAEELWHRLGHTGSLAYELFPAANPALLVDDTVEIPVQIGGKIRTKIIVPTNADKAAYEAAAMADDKVQAALAGKTIQKVIIVPGKMINIVAK